MGLGSREQRLQSGSVGHRCAGPALTRGGTEQARCLAGDLRLSRPSKSPKCMGTLAF